MRWFVVRLRNLAMTAPGSGSSALSGNGNTALTLIAHSTYLSSPDAFFGP